MAVHTSAGSTKSGLRFGFSMSTSWVAYPVTAPSDYLEEVIPFCFPLVDAT